MKILTSVLALVLVGLVGGWLWLDATAVARQDLSGVLVTGPVDPATATSLVEGGPGGLATASNGVRAGAAEDRLVTALRASAGALTDGLEQERREQAREAKAKATEKAKKAKEAKEQPGTGGGADGSGVPVQPPPVNPGGWCEWDDGVWECDDWDDDEDDDEWDD